MKNDHVKKADFISGTCPQLHKSSTLWTLNFLLRGILK